MSDARRRAAERAYGEPASLVSRVRRGELSWERVELAAALGYMMVRQQDPVGLFVFDEKVRAFLPPKAKRSHLTNILTRLAKTKPFSETPNDVA